MLARFPGRTRTGSGHATGYSLPTSPRRGKRAGPQVQVLCQDPGNAKEARMEARELGLGLPNFLVSLRYSLGLVETNE